MAKLIGFKSIQDKITTFLSKELANKEILTRLAELMRQRIFNETKLGNSLATKEKSKLKALSEGYIKYRQSFQKIHPTGSSFSPRRSNLTLTGQMLDALTYKVSEINKSFEIFVDDSARAPTPQISLRKIKEPKTMSNSDVAKEVASKGRPFIGLDETAVKRIKNEIIKDLRSKLRRSGLRK